MCFTRLLTHRFLFASGFTLHSQPSTSHEYLHLSGSAGTHRQTALGPPFCKSIGHSLHKGQRHFSPIFSSNSFSSYISQQVLWNLPAHARTIRSPSQTIIGCKQIGQSILKHCSSLRNLLLSVRNVATTTSAATSAA